MGCRSSRVVPVEEDAVIATSKVGDAPITRDDFLGRAAASTAGEPVGVSMAFVEAFMAEFLEPNGNWTTTDVCLKVVVPRTRDRMCAYVDLLDGMKDETGRPFVGRANVFVSHAWKYNILDVFDAMRHRAQSRPDSYFWFDLFVNNQNTAVDLPQDWWLTTFKDSIRSIGAVLLVLSPWNDPIPVKRAWCLWEIMCALGQSHVELVISLPSSQVQALKQGVVENPKSILTALATIQAEKAEAFISADKDKIFHAIEASVGFLHVNKSVKDRLRDWYVDTLQTIAAEAFSLNTEESALLLHQIAYVFSDLGRVDESLHLYERSLVVRLLLFGRNHATVASLYNNIGEIHRGKGQIALAITHFETAIDIKSTILGANHDSLAASYNNLGLVYRTQRDYDKAIEMFEKAIAIRANSPESTAVASYYNNIGLTQDNKGDLDLAIANYEKSLEIKLNVLGPKHPETATTYNNLATVYQKRRDYDKALQYYQKDIDINIATVGVNHVNTARGYSNLASVYGNQGKYADALNFYEKALSIRLATVGLDHPTTALGYANLAIALMNMKKWTEAIEKLTAALEIKTRIKVEDPVNVAITRKTLASALASSGQAEQALKICNEILPLFVSALGPTHLRVAQTHAVMAVAFAVDTNHQPEAMQHFNQAIELYQALKDNEVNIAEVQADLAEYLIKLEQRETARELLVGCVAVFEQLLGAMHPRTVEVAQVLRGLQHPASNAEQSDV